MFWFILGYALFGMASGLLSISMHKKQHPDNVEIWRLAFVFLLNGLLFPITIPMAIYNGKL